MNLRPAVKSGLPFDMKVPSGNCVYLRCGRGSSKRQRVRIAGLQ